MPSKFSNLFREFQVNRSKGDILRKFWVLLHDINCCYYLLIYSIIFSVCVCKKPFRIFFILWILTIGGCSIISIFVVYPPDIYHLTPPRGLYIVLFLLINPLRTFKWTGSFPWHGHEVLVGMKSKMKAKQVTFYQNYCFELEGWLKSDTKSGVN